MKNKIPKSRKGENFGGGIAVIAASILISLFVFWNSGSGITGFAAYEPQNEYVGIIQSNLIQFKDIDSLTLAAGNYYIDNSGIVYWMSKEGRVPAAKINFVDESQKNRIIYIDNEGRIGYVLSSTG